MTTEEINKMIEMFLSKDTDSIKLAHDLRNMQSKETKNTIDLMFFDAIVNILQTLVK